MPQSTPHLLLVDDESALRTVTADRLRERGFEVVEADTGEKALELLDQFAFDILVTDLRLPGADGFAVLDHARTVSTDTVVLLMTAYASLDSAVDALRRGAHDYPLKPLSLAAPGTKIPPPAQHRPASSADVRYPPDDLYSLPPALCDEIVSYVNTKTN